MKSLPSILSLLVIATAGVGSDAQASMVWNETVQGDLSNDGLAPTALTFAMGSNIVTGFTGEALRGERDYFSLTVPTGALLTALVVRPETFVSGSSGFIGMQAGPQVTVSPSGAGSENLLGFLHYENDSVGRNLLPDLARAYPSGLASGAYSVWIQELGGVVPYGFDFVVTPVPLPASGLLLLSGLFGVGTWSRRAKRSTI